VATIEVIDPDTGVATREAHDVKVVSLEGETRLQREVRAMVKREYARISHTWKLGLEPSLVMTRGAAQLIAKELVNEALRNLVEDISGKQVALPLPAERREDNQA
jgi:hypothetical protein